MIKKSLSKFFKNDIATISVIFAVMLIIFVLTSDPLRLGFSLTSISKDVAIYAIVGMAQMATLAVGQFNLALAPLAVLPPWSADI